MSVCENNEEFLEEDKIKLLKFAKCLSLEGNNYWFPFNYYYFLFF